MANNVEARIQRICDCGNTMEAVIFGYLPVPEDHYLGHKIQLTCPVCRKCRVVYFWACSSSDYDAFASLDIPTKINDRVNAAVLEICNLVWSYERHCGRPTININRVAEMLRPLSAEDFPILHAELDLLSSESATSLGKICFASSPAVSPDAENPAKEGRVIDYVVKLIKMVEEKRKSI